MRNRQFLFAISLAAAVILYGFVRLYSLPKKKIVAPSETEPPIGVSCAVELRPPLPSGFSSLNLKGKLRLANDRWLVIYNEDKPNEGDLWIPRESVLWMVVGPSASSYKGIQFWPNQ